MAETLYHGQVGEQIAVAMATGTADGDLHPRRVDPATLMQRQLGVAEQRWVMVDEVHGAAVHEVDRATPAWPLAGIGDVIVNSQPHLPIAIWAADCAPIALFGDRGTTVAVHAGWRGLAAGVIEVALARFAERDEQPLVAVLGPVIHPCCYEFGADDLRAVADGIHTDPDAISGRTTGGAVALDVPAAVREALREHDPLLAAGDRCTGCGGGWFSHRLRRDSGRHALVAWTEELGAVR